MLRKKHEYGQVQHPVNMPFWRPRRIKRFAWFTPWLARGGQPSAKALQWLAAHGVQTIVNLREHDGRRAVEAAGLQYVHIPVKNDRAPTEEQVLEWLRLCEHHDPSRAVFVHCEAGEGRTSTFCAAVRLAQGWTARAAIDEQRRFDFKPEGKHREQAQFLERFAERVSQGLVVPPRLRTEKREAV
ncbi:MAG TPA: protein-tyrosine phosphatase family protein [Candidatus Baltobacteraceae bacterium]|nr:protein-tyrosine phosphatase family protein [Candidatus Baltobacteraceae bacterium]